MKGPTKSRRIQKKLLKESRQQKESIAIRCNAAPQCHVADLSVPWLRWPNASWHQLFRLPEGWASICRGKLKFRVAITEYKIYYNHTIWSEMGPHGTILAHIKTVRSPMAQEHFWIPPDPKNLWTSKHDPSSRSRFPQIPKSTIIGSK